MPLNYQDMVTHSYGSHCLPKFLNITATTSTPCMGLACAGSGEIHM